MNTFRGTQQIDSNNPRGANDPPGVLASIQGEGQMPNRLRATFRGQQFGITTGRGVTKSTRDNDMGGEEV